jgi:hypothetical protein
MTRKIQIHAMAAIATACLFSTVARADVTLREEMSRIGGDIRSLASDLDKIEMERVSLTVRAQGYLDQFNNGGMTPRVKLGLRAVYAAAVGLYGNLAEIDTKLDFISQDLNSLRERAKREVAGNEIQARIAKLGSNFELLDRHYLTSAGKLRDLMQTLTDVLEG